ncbi:hypothetical protein JOB18_034969 [Solea senegalensis]|uniref:KBD domain-containing protein n=1 Tax=Solea senegalensis TaxID=28829 RepID=A0AAV6S7M2_SOLSE|nr:hypothetical protein JOB18_034969 [Solea senegalensis]
MASSSLISLEERNTTDSSSNSSQKLEGSLQPLESSPLPQRHKCVMGHRHDLHDPYRLSDHFFLDQPLSRLTRHVTFQEDEEIVRINPRERSWERTTEHRLGRQSDRPWLRGYEDYRHATVRDKFIQMEDSESYVHFAKTDAQKHDYTYPLAPALSPSDSDPALGPLTNKGHGGSYRHGFSSVVSTQPRSFLPSSSPSTNGGKGRKEGGMERAQCEHCGEAFYVADNRRGRCQDAPDPLTYMSCIAYAAGTCDSHRGRRAVSLRMSLEKHVGDNDGAQEGEGEGERERERREEKKKKVPEGFGGLLSSSAAANSITVHMCKHLRYLLV